VTRDPWPAAVTGLLETLSDLDGFAARLQTLAVGAPGPGSDADLDGAIGFTGATYAAQNLAMGVDHLRAWRWILQSGRVPQFAHMTLMRAAFEGAATALWLLGSADSAERIRRAAVFGLEDLRNRRVFEGLVASRAREEAAERGEELKPFEWGSAKSGAARYDDRLAEMRSSGIEKADIPNYSSLIEDYGPGAHVYALTSAFAHRREWTLAFADELDRIADTGAPGAGAIQVAPSARWALTITESVMDEVRRALDDLESHQSGVRVKARSGTISA
jgi:hypothetical protein